MVCLTRIINVQLHSTRAMTVRTLCEQTIHHAADKFELVLEAEVDKVGIDEDAVRRYKGVVMLQEQ